MLQDKNNGFNIGFFSESPEKNEVVKKGLTETGVKIFSEESLKNCWKRTYKGEHVCEKNIFGKDFEKPWLFNDMKKAVSTSKIWMVALLTDTDSLILAFSSVPFKSDGNWSEDKNSFLATLVENDKKLEIVPISQNLHINAQVWNQNNLIFGGCYPSYYSLCIYDKCNCVYSNCSYLSELGCFPHSSCHFLNKKVRHCFRVKEIEYFEYSN